MRGTKQALAGPVYLCIYEIFYGWTSTQTTNKTAITCRAKFTNGVSLSTCDKSTIAVLNCTILIETGITKQNKKLICGNFSSIRTITCLPPPHPKKPPKKHAYCFILNYK